MQSIGATKPRTGRCRAKNLRGAGWLARWHYRNGRSSLRPYRLGPHWGALRHE